jgi:putative transposase
MELFVQAYPEDIHIIELDNGGHQVLDLILPENLIILFNSSRVDTNPQE